MKDNDTRSIDLFDIPDRDERGVSPVIGVILMVAITVILAAVIASFVLGFGQNVQQSVNAGADISADMGNPGSADVTWISEGNADKLNVTVTSATGATGLPKSQTIEDVGGVVTIGENSSVTSSDIDLGISTAQETTVTIVVKAVKGQTTTVIQKKTVTI